MNRDTFELLPAEVQSEWERMAFLHGVYEHALGVAAKEACGLEDPAALREVVASYVAGSTLELIGERPHYALRAFGGDALERLLEAIAPKEEG